MLVSLPWSSEILSGTRFVIVGGSLGTFDATSTTANCVSWLKNAFSKALLFLESVMAGAEFRVAHTYNV